MPETKRNIDICVDSKTGQCTAFSLLVHTHMYMSINDADDDRVVVISIITLYIFISCRLDMVGKADCASFGRQYSQNYGSSTLVCPAAHAIESLLTATYSH